MSLPFKKIVILLILIFSFVCHGSDQYIVDGEFWAAEGDSNSFIKQQLKISALKDALNQFFKQMDLNSSVFWQVLDRKVADDLESKKVYYEKLIEKARNEQNFEKVLQLETKWRSNRLNFYSDYLDEKRLYLSFSSSGITSSMVNPMLKMAKFKVLLNRQMVKRLYFDITKSNLNRRYKNLFISMDISIPETEKNISEVNDHIGPIKEAILKKWVSWFEKEYADIFSAFVITSDEQQKQLSKYILSPPGSINTPELNPDEEISTNGDENLENENITSTSEMNEEGPKVAIKEHFIKNQNEMEIFNDSQWLSIHIKIEKIDKNEIFKKFRFKLGGGHLFFDLNSREIILAEDFETEHKIFIYDDINSFSSELGTHFYNLPISGFREGKRIFTKAPQINNQAQLTIKNIKNPEQIIGLTDFLNLGGSSVNLKVKNFDYDYSGAKIILNYFGELDNLKAKFMEWENKNVIPSNKWHFSSVSEDLTVELEQIGTMVPESTNLEE